MSKKLAQPVVLFHAQHATHYTYEVDLVAQNTCKRFKKHVLCSAGQGNSQKQYQENSQHD